MGNYFPIQDPIPPPPPTMGNLYHRVHILRDNDPVTPREEM